MSIPPNVGGNYRQGILIEHSCRLRAKIKTIGDKFETREQHYKALLRSKDAEIQSLTAKYEEQRRGADTEAARCRALSSQVSTFSHTEAELRSQLNIYVEKFKQVGPLSHRLLALFFPTSVTEVCPSRSRSTVLINNAFYR